MQNKHSIIRILGITTLIVLLLLFSSSAVAETKPDGEKVFDDWATLDMNSLLRSYNIIAFGNVTLDNHQNGGVLIKGNLNGDQSYADGAVTLPSYVQGYVDCSAPYHQAGTGTVIPPLYVGTSNKITHPPYNENHYILNEKTDYGIVTPIYKDTDDRVFLDFDDVRTLLNTASEGYISGASNITISDEDKQKAQKEGELTINIEAGSKISIDASLVNEASPVINCINIQYDGRINGGITDETIINIIQSDSNNPIPVFLPYQKINGEQLGKIQNSVHLGTNIIFNLPGTEQIFFSDKPHIGHVIAPDADISIEKGQYNGTIICNNFTCKAEGHLYPKGGSPIPQYPTLEIPVTKTTANAPANSNAQFSFTITGKNNAPMPENSTITIGPNDTVSFDPIEYTFIGRYEYEITEEQTGLPSGYTADGTKYTLVVDVDYNSTQTDFVFDVTVTNDRNTDDVKKTLENSIVFTNTYNGTGGETPEEQPKGEIHLTKVSASNTNWKLSGAEYSVYEDEACTEFVGLLKTDDNGTATLGNLDTTKDYYVKETKAPADHWVDTTVYPVSFTTGSTEFSVNVANIYAPGEIIIEKKVESENSADLNKEFRFSISLATPEEAKTYINGITCARIETNGKPTSIPVDPLGITNKGGNFFIDLKHGEKFVISSLPQGTTYTISEKPCEGFETSISINGTVVTNCSGTIPTDKNPTYCLFTNNSTATNPDNPGSNPDDPDDKEELTPEQQAILDSMPQTGDNQTLFVWLVMLACSLFGLLSILRRRSN